MQDTPLQVDLNQPQSIKDTPLNESLLSDLISKSGKERDLIAVKASFLKKYNEGSDPVESYTPLKSDPNLDQTVEQLKQQKIALDKQALSDEFSNNPYGNSGDPVTHAGLIVDLQKNLEKKSSLDQQFVDSISDPNLPEDQKQYLSNYMWFYESMGKTLQDNYSTADKIGSVASNIVPFVDSIKRMNLTGKYLNQKDAVQEMVVGFKSLPLDQQKEVWPTLQKEVFDALGPVTGLETLQNFIEPSGESDISGFSNWWKALDVVDAVGIGTAIIKRTKSLREAFNIPKLLKASGNEEEAAAVSARNLSSDAAREMSQVDEVTSFSNAAPFDVSLEDAAYTSGLAGPTKDALREQFGIIDATVQDILEGRGRLGESILNTKERAIAEKKVIDFLKTAEIENIRVVYKVPTENISKIDTLNKDIQKNISDLSKLEKQLESLPKNSPKKALKTEIKSLREEIAIQRSEKDSLSQTVQTKETFKITPENVKISGETGNTTTFSYQIRDENGDLIDQTHELVLTRNDVGAYDITAVGPIEKNLASPTAIFKGLAREDVNSAQRIDNEVAQIFNKLDDLQEEILKPLGSLLRPRNRKRLKSVDDALIKGDAFIDPATGERGKVYDPEELRTLFNLDTAQQQVYYGMNRLFNNVWIVRNHLLRDHMLAFNYKRIKLLDNETSFGKVYETDNDAKLSKSSSIAYDTTSDREITSLTPEVIDRQYALGKRLVKLDEPYRAGAEGVHYDHVFVNAEDVSELPMVVLARKKGYVARIYKDARFFAKEFHEIKLNGGKGTKTTTHRFFDTRYEATKYIDKLRKEWAANKVLEDVAAGKDELAATKVRMIEANKKFQVLTDRELEIEANSTGKLGYTGSGGLYTGARAEDALLFGINGEEGRRLSAFESMTNTIANISRLIPINQWRLGLEQRWINTANEILHTPVTSFKKLQESGESLESIRFLNTMHDQIRSWEGFPTAEERFFNAVTQNLTEWSVRKTDEKGLLSKALTKTRAKELIGWMRDKDPVGRARAIAFHNLLGWYNPVQLWVQMQGGMVAASASFGKNLTKDLKATMGLTVLRTETSPVLIKRAARIAGIEEEQMLNMIEAWNKTGLQDAILQTADHAAAIKGHGIAFDALGRAADKGLVFYRTGELFNRRLSFSVAFNEWVAKTGRSNPADAELKGIVDRTHDFMLNMNKANRAYWQKGVLSLPTQFWQVTTKSLETILGLNGNLTRAERGKLAMSQLMLYGTAGVPLANFANDFATQVAGLDPEQHPYAAKAINEGFWGWVTLSAFGLDHMFDTHLGADLQIGSRGSLLNGVSSIVDDIIYSDKPIAEKFLGAFGSTNYRFWNEFTNRAKPFILGAEDPTLLTTSQLLVSPFLHTVSTWNNLEKAMYMHFVDEYYNSNKNKVVHRDFSLTEELSKAIGFSLADDKFITDVNKALEAQKGIESNVVSIIMDRYYHNALLTSMGMQPNWEDWDQFKATMIHRLPMDSQTRIMDRVKEKILDPKTNEERAISQYYKYWLKEKTLDDLLSINETLKGNSIIVPPLQEEK